MLSVTVNIPQFEHWKEQLMDALQPIKDSIDRATSALAAEVQEIAILLRNTANPTQQEIAAVATRIDALADAIMHVSDAFDAPPPTP